MLRCSVRLTTAGLVVLLAVVVGAGSLDAQLAVPETARGSGIEPLSLGVPSSTSQRTLLTTVPGPTPATALLRGVQEATGGDGDWRRGFLIGGLIGAGVGLVLHAVVDSFPCDTCSGTGSDSRL